MIVTHSSANIHNRSCYDLQKIKLGKPVTLIKKLIIYVAGLVSSAHPDRKQWCEKLPGTLSTAPAETLINSTASRRGRHLQYITLARHLTSVCSKGWRGVFKHCATSGKIIQKDG